MDFFHDLAKISKQELLDSNIKVPIDWDDYDMVLNYLEMSKRWFDCSIPYKVVYSKELLQKLPLLTFAEQTAIKDIEKCLSECKPITDYMSKLIRKTEMNKSDFFLKNWDIYHLHLEKITAIKTRFTMPNLLFFQQKGNIVHFIDVRKHPTGSEWFVKDLLEIVYNNWPWLFIYLKGVKPTINIPDAEIHELTKNVVTIIDFHDGALMPTTAGVTSSGHSSMSVRKADRYFNGLKESEKWLIENENALRKSIYKQLKIKITEPLDYELIIENRWFVAYEKKYKVKIKLFKVN